MISWFSVVCCLLFVVCFSCIAGGVVPQKDGQKLSLRVALKN